MEIFESQIIYVANIAIFQASTTISFNMDRRPGGYAHKFTVLTPVFAHPVISRIRIYMSIAKSLERLRSKLLLCED